MDKMNQIAEAYRAGQSLRQIARTHNVSTPTVKHYLDKAGVTTRRSGAQNDPDRDARALALHREGKSNREVAAVLGVSDRGAAKMIARALDVEAAQA